MFDRSDTLSTSDRRERDFDSSETPVETSHLPLII